jgi:DNA-binding NarL/FixJ family response regulator
MIVTTIAIVDDHRVVSRSLKAYLESFPGLSVVGIAASGEEVLDHLAAWRPDIVLQDLLMPGGLNGVETTRRILARAPGVRVIALTASTDEARLMGVLRAGAAGYVRKDSEPEVLLAAVRAVAGGHRYIDPSAGSLRARLDADDELTPREIQVLRRIALGHSNKEIAVALEVSEETIKTHVGHVLAKLHVESRGQATARALTRGLVAIEDLT